MATEHLTFAPLSKHPRFVDLTGKRFGRLTVLGFAGGRKWFCRCDCSNISTTLAYGLTGGKSTSCGCYRDSLPSPNRTHGEGGYGSSTREHQTWIRMINRCHCSTNAGYYKYGARGIAVCQGWRASYETFLADMGRRPSDEHSIDRKENDRGYDCGHCDDCKARQATANCRWATPAEQTRNTRRTHFITFQGETLCLKDWATRLGFTPSHLLYRIAQWGEEQALTTPKRKCAKRTR